MTASSFCTRTLVGIVICGGCAGRAPEASSPAVVEPRAASPTELSVDRTVVTPNEAVGVGELFERARADLEDERYEPAARAFDRIVELDPDGPYAARALFYGGTAHDYLAHHEEALDRYESVARRWPRAQVAQAALLRALRLATYLEQWKRAGLLADRLTGRLDSLSPVEQALVHGGKALSVVEGEGPDAAEYFIAKGRSVVERYRLDAAGELPRDLAPLFFALGELRRIRGEQIDFVPPPERFAEVLEQRCQLLLDAQSAYSDAMRAHDAHWSAMAGYRVGELYQRLHEDLMRVPPPAVASGDERRARLFEGAMRLRYSILLDKGLTMMEHTVRMAERTNERSEWVVRAREARHAIREAIKLEQAAIDRLPYTREQLEQALEDLAARAAKVAQPGA